MHGFTPVLLLALSPLTILAQPPRAQTAWPELHPVVDHLDTFVTMYRHMLKVSDQDAWDCKSVRRPCQQLVELIGKSIGESNGALVDAANVFVPKVPCAEVDRVFGQVRTVIEKLNEMLRREIAKGKQLRAFKFWYFLFHRHLLAQADAVVKIGSIFANNTACNNPQSPAQLRAFAEKVEAIRANDVNLEKIIWDLVEDDRPSASGDHLEVTISIRGANSDRQEIE